MANVTIETRHLVEKIGTLSRQLSMSQLEAQTRSENEDRLMARITELEAEIAKPKSNRAERRAKKGS